MIKFRQNLSSVKFMFKKKTTSLSSFIVYNHPTKCVIVFLDGDFAHKHINDGTNHCCYFIDLHLQMENICYTIVYFVYNPAGIGQASGTASISRENRFI